MKTIHTYKECAGAYVVHTNIKAAYVVKQPNGKWLAYASWDKRMVTDELETMAKAMVYAKRMVKEC